MLLMHPGRIDLVFGGDFDLLGSVAERDEVSAE